MNAQRIKQLERLRYLAQDIEYALENLGHDIDDSCDNLERQDMTHLPVYDQLDNDRDLVCEAQNAVADLWQALDAAIHG